MFVDEDEIAGERALLVPVWLEEVEDEDRVVDTLGSELVKLELATDCERDELS